MPGWSRRPGWLAGMAPIIAADAVITYLDVHDTVRAIHGLRSTLPCGRGAAHFAGTSTDVVARSMPAIGCHVCRATPQGGLDHARLRRQPASDNETSRGCGPDGSVQPLAAVATFDGVGIGFRSRRPS